MEFEGLLFETISMSWEGSKYGIEKYTFTDADAGDLPVNERSDDDEEARYDIKVDMLIWLSESSLLDWF